MSMQICKVWCFTSFLAWEVHLLQPLVLPFSKHISFFSTFPQKTTFSFLQMLCLGKPLLCWDVQGLSSHCKPTTLFTWTLLNPV